MDRKGILEAIEEEIGRLERVRDLLAAAGGKRAVTATGAKANGREPHPAKKRILSDDARNRIAQAQKRRWARQRTETAAALGA